VTARASYVAAVVHYRTYDLLERCLLGLRSQVVAPERVLVVDADGDGPCLEELRKRFPEVEFESVENRGFAANANRAIRSLRARGQAEFALILNADVELDPGFGRALSREMAANPAVGLATGKLLRPGGAIIDSAGIRLPRHRRPRDRGSERTDRGQFDDREYVFGATGAALFVRIRALEDLELDGEIFDEDFFMYHEDTDLSWRANLLGWKVAYVPEARATHVRGWQRNRRFDVAPELRRHSFKNHYLQIIKNERARDFWLGLPVLASWEVLRLGHALLRDRALLPGYGDALRLSGRAWRKRRLLQARVRDRVKAPSSSRTSAI